MTRAAEDVRDGDPDEQERVRICPECNEIVDYHLRDCPACGYHDPLLEFPNLGAETRACEDCGAEMLHTLVFCPKCGAERDALPRVPFSEHREPESGRRDARSNTTWAWVLALVGPLAMLAAVLSVYI